jgi:hypothetical protein
MSGPAIQEAIRAAKGTPGSTLEATTPAGHAMLGFGVTDQVLAGTANLGDVFVGALPPDQRPAYEVLKQAHWGWNCPEYVDSTHVRQLIGENTCTIRMSRGLNYLGVLVPLQRKWKVKRKFPPVDENAKEYMVTVKGSDGLNYAIRSREMIDWLRGEWGEPDYEYPAGDNGQSGKDRKPGKLYAPETSVSWGKKGVIAFALPQVPATNTDRSPASGHIDV